MANKENKILEELRRRGTIFEDPCSKSGKHAAIQMILNL